MKRKIITFITLLKAGRIKNIGQLILCNYKVMLYKIRAWLEDIRVGGASLERLIPTKYAELGAHPTQSTDYRLLDHVFETCPIKKDDVIADIGCGEGRILSYLYLRGFKNTKMVGVELDPDISEIAKKRTAKCKNIEVRCANALDCADLISGATVLILSNPFDEEIVRLFVYMLENSCKHDLKIYFLYDYNSRHILDKRDHWHILRRGIVTFPKMYSHRYTVYKYSQSEK